MLSPPLNSWLEDVKLDDIIVDNNPKTEARDNQWSFMLSSDQAAGLSLDELSAFVKEVINAKHLEIKRRKLPNLLFYLWFDESSATLRFSLTSITNPASLNFRCEVDSAADLSMILEGFLSSSHSNGVFLFDEFSEVSPGIASDQLQRQILLNVFTTELTPE